MNKSLKSGRTPLGLVLVALATSACTIPQSIEPIKSEVVPAVPVTTASLPTIVQPYPRIEATLACIKETGVLEGITFRVGSFADSTGKINSVAAGATGNFMPQGGSSAYITDAIRKAGARVVSTYFGAPAQPVRSDYAINGIFNSLDFGAPVDVDMRVGGIGPVIGRGFAQLTLSIQLDQADTRINKQISMVQRPVRYQHYGIGVGRDIDGTLVTGAAVHRGQERLQFEALNGPIALGIADVVMKEFPVAERECRNQVVDLLETLK